MSCKKDRDCIYDELDEYNHASFHNTEYDIILQESMKKLMTLEYVIAAVLIVSGMFMMLNGYKTVALHMEQGKTQPYITNFKHADKVIVANLPTAKPKVDKLSVKVDQVVFEKVYTTSFQNFTDLSDVTIGKDMDGHITDGKTSSTIKTQYDPVLKQFKLYGTFTHMPKLREGFYYEGWVVRKEPFSMYSVGKVMVIDEEMTSVYVTETDLTDHTMFILTLEHNDGNPNPEVQILEGEFKKL